MILQKHKCIVHLFGYSIFSFKKLTFDELKVVVKECQLTMVLVLNHVQSETQKHVIGVFPTVNMTRLLI